VRGPIRRRGWTEWAPTAQATAAAIERLFTRDPQLIEALKAGMPA
jgi:hypothetical protein